jgi:hypothetical protein
LRELLIDTTQAAGRPNRRLVYADNGKVQRIESPISTQ